MFKKSRRKIVASIMSVLVVLWVGTLGVIYACSYFEMEKQNRGMLREHALRYTLSQPDGAPPPAKPQPDFGNPRDFDMPSFWLSTFYSVAMTYEGEIIEIRNPQEKLHSNEELETLAGDILSRGNTTGIKNNLVYYVLDKGGYTLFAFKDNTVINESMYTLFRYTLIFGGFAIVALFFLAVYLAKRIVMPLEESYRKQRQFISDAGHELKTPIAVVNANAELLLREYGENQWICNIQYENGRMGVLVGQLLELARTENVTVPKERLDFSRLVTGEALPFESAAFEKELNFSYDIEESLYVYGNGNQLKQLVSILLDNAVSHSKSGGEIICSLKRERNVLKLSVINRGEEIPPEEMEHLFERFYRRDRVRNSEGGHYGLGLAIAKGIAAAHSGDIKASCREGKIEFEFSLPCKK